MDADKATTILKRDAHGVVNEPREQREALVAEFERSSLPATKFAQAAGINYQTFAWWVQQRRHARGDYKHRAQAKSSAVRFVEAVPALAVASSPVEQLQRAGDPTALELLLPCGARFTITSGHQATLAAQLLNALHTPC